MHMPSIVEEPGRLRSRKRPVWMLNIEYRGKSNEI